MRRLALALLVLAFGCGGPGRPTIFAAASLRDLMREAAAAGEWEADLHLAASSTLRAQIEQGARSSLMIGADLESVRDMGREPVPLWRNDLVVVVPASGVVCDGCTVTRPADLPNLPCVAVAAPEMAPAGRYARDALGALGLWDEVRPLATGAANVRVALGQVATGACPAGIVYRTDAASTGAVRVAIPLDSPRPVTYYAVALDGRGVDFLAFLTGPAGRGLALEAGLRPVEDSP